MKIEVFEITSKEDKVYRELLEQYKTNPEVQESMNKSIFPDELIWAGDFRLITMLDSAIDMNNIKVYLVKDVDNDIFVWTIGKFVDSGKLSMHPLLKEQSKELQLAIRSVLLEKGLFKKSNAEMAQDVD